MDSNSQEFYDMMDFFERTHKHVRCVREKNKSLRHCQVFYESGEANTQFVAFMEGVAYGESVTRSTGDDMLEALRAIKANRFYSKSKKALQAIIDTAVAKAEGRV